MKDDDEFTITDRANDKIQKLQKISNGATIHNATQKIQNIILAKNLYDKNPTNENKELLDYAMNDADDFMIKWIKRLINTIVILLIITFIIKLL